VSLNCKPIACTMRSVDIMKFWVYIPLTAFSSGTIGLEIIGVIVETVPKPWVVGHKRLYVDVQTSVICMA
jgi:hypothetical protein